MPAKPKYEQWITPQGLERITGWVRDGLTDGQIADKCRVSVFSLYGWMKKFPEVKAAFYRERVVKVKPPKKPKEKKRRKLDKIDPAIRGVPPPGKYDVASMIVTIREYTDKSALPVLKDCCYQNDWSYDHVMKLQAADEDLRQSIRRLHDRKEYLLEAGALANKLNPGMAKLSLMQPVHGWRLSYDIDTQKETMEKLAEVLGKITGNI